MSRAKELLNVLEVLNPLKDRSIDSEDEIGVPKKDGSGKGVRANKNRGGCLTSKND